MRVCPEPGCPNLTTGGPCDQHRQTTTQRGYGTKHQRAKRRWQIIINQRGAVCARFSLGQCVESNAMIPVGSRDWALDHDDDDRTRYIGPSHKRCNDIAGARKS